jgi:6-phospho-3-hexuloisomerase
MKGRDMKSFKDLAETVIEENRAALLDMDTDEIDHLIEAIAGAKKIQVFGMGRMKCAVRAFTMRLMHMGLDAHVVNDTTCPNIGKGDLLIVNCGCTAVGLVVIRLAKKAGATVCVITAHPDSEAGQLADFTVRLRAQVNPGNPDEQNSVQPMAACFEQSIFLFEDILIMMLMEKLSVAAQQMERRHTNVDGYMSID